MSDLGKQPVERQPDKLGSAFGAPRRGSGAAALGAPPPSAPVMEPAVEQPPAKPAAKPKTSPSKPVPAKAKPKNRSGTRPVTTAVYLPRSVRDRLRTAADRDGLTYTDILLDAIDAEHHRLADLLGPTQIARRDDSLFSGRRPARGAQRSSGDDQIQITVRPTRDDLAVIDQLVAEHGAPSRSGMAAAVLDAYLSQ